MLIENATLQAGEKLSGPLRRNVGFMSCLGLDSGQQTGAELRERDGATGQLVHFRRKGER